VPDAPLHRQAIVPTWHDILVAFHSVVRDRVPFRALDPDWHEQRNSTEPRVDQTSHPTAHRTARPDRHTRTRRL